MTVRIGITGPIGCGKSAVAGWLAERPGVVAIDADAVARQVLAPGTPETAAVLSRFGDQLLRDDGSLDRPALGRIVFGDPDALRDLEAIVHPGVRVRILAGVAAAEAASAAAVVVEAIKLVEGGLADVCHEVWLVACGPSVQLQRLLARGTTESDARARIEAQHDPARRLRSRATRVIDTSGTPEDTRREAMAAFEAALVAH